MKESDTSSVRVKVVGLGGAGGNAILRMAGHKIQGLDFLSVNTDVQALSGVRDIATFAIGPTTTRGMGSGGDPDVGREAIRESREQLSQLMQDADLVFITAGMGGGTGTGAAATMAEIARQQGALTVAVVTRPFSFEGPRRRDVAERGIRELQPNVDTLITVENDRLLSSLDGGTSLDRAFRLADEVLRQGVQGISEIITVPGLINVDFADVKSVLGDGGPSFMAMGEGKGRRAAQDALGAALSNPLFDAPIRGARGVLLNVRGGKDLSLGQVHEIAGSIGEACGSQANVVLGVVQQPRWKKRVAITLVATGLAEQAQSHSSAVETFGEQLRRLQPSPPPAENSANGRRGPAVATPRMF